MKLFHISDVISITTGRLVSSRHIDGVYDVLNFLTGDDLHTHQLPRASNECLPWLRTQFPVLFPEDPKMAALLRELTTRMEDPTLKGNGRNNDSRSVAVASWVESVRTACGLPVMLPVYEMGADMHTHIDPLEEAEAMVGKDRVIRIDA